MAYQVVIIREDDTHEFVCENFGNGVFDNSIACQDVLDPCDGSKYHKTILLSPGDIINVREIEE